ncbi:unnamed protein product [Rhizophagus irregularis]|nr:unnamed protein product [Rhizophagus irregularis]
MYSERNKMMLSLNFPISTPVGQKRHADSEPVDTGPKRLKIVPFQDVFEKLKENILIKEPRNFILIQSNMSLDVSTKVKYQLVVKTL